MRAMLVTAGFGTRLLPLTELLPKPAVPVCNRPIAWYALDHLRRSGVREFVANTHHLPNELERELGAVTPGDVQLRFVHEPEILGTGGGVRNAWRPIDGETFLVMNGKYVFAPDIAGALRVHRDSGALATMILKPAVVGDPLG
jgi:mannose-1-phosphate guanylyltransferase